MMSSRRSLSRARLALATAVLLLSVLATLTLSTTAAAAVASETDGDSALPYGAVAHSKNRNIDFSKFYPPGYEPPSANLPGPRYVRKQ